MKQSLYSVILLLLLFPAVGMSESTGSYWQCRAHDTHNKQWFFKSTYQKVALNLSFEACKKESQIPTSCAASKMDCEGFFQGVSTSPMWRCTALDVAAGHWPSNLYTQRDDAALAAKSYCKANSSEPETCYINMVTCMNLNDGN